MVLWPTDMYISDNNTQYHSKLPSDPTPIFKRKLDNLLESAKITGIINPQEFSFLTVQHPVIPTLYLLSKINKDSRVPPGRPIVAGIRGLSEKACMFVDYHLQPFVLHLPSYLRDSTSMIQLFEDFEYDGKILLVTCDVESLYTNISHQHGIAAVTHFLDSEEGRDRMLDSFIVDLLNYNFCHN